MYVIKIKKFKGKYIGNFIDEQINENQLEVSNGSTRVSIPGSIYKQIQDGYLIASDGIYWQTGRKIWKMTNVRVIGTIIDSKSSIFKEIRLSKDDYNKYVFPKEETDDKSTEEVVKEEDISEQSMEKAGYYISNDIWNLLKRNILRRGRRMKNTLLLGPSGSGKTSLVKVACELLNLPFSKFDMGACIGDATTSLLGVHRIIDGKSVFDYSEFTEKIQEPGVILLDEINRADQTAMNILLPLLDTECRELRVDIAGSSEKRVIKVNPDCVFVATANIGSEYAGTNEMDSALRNRLFTIQLADLPKDAETKVLSVKSNIDENSAKDIVKISASLRDNYKKGKLSYKISIRETLEVADLVADGYPIKEALKLVYIPKFSGTLEEGEQSIVSTTIDSFTIIK